MSGESIEEPYHRLHETSIQRKSRETAPITRRNFLKSAALGVGMASFPNLLGATEPGEDRPNILWLVSEDNSPLLGC